MPTAGPRNLLREISRPRPFKETDKDGILHIPENHTQKATVLVMATSNEVLPPSVPARAS
jgi:hypothetical protein